VTLAKKLKVIDQKILTDGVQILFVQSNHALAYPEVIPVLQAVLNEEASLIELSIWHNKCNFFSFR
jgi:hypothetical protein